MQILLSGSQSAADMTLGFVHIQHLPRLLRQRRIHLHQPLRHVLVHCAFADAEGLRGLPHRGVVVDDIVGYPYSSFFNIVFQRKTPQDTFLQCMKVFWGLYPFLFLVHKHPCIILSKKYNIGKQLYSNRHHSRIPKEGSYEINENRTGT